MNDFRLKAFRKSALKASSVAKAMAKLAMKQAHKYADNNSMLAIIEAGLDGAADYASDGPDEVFLRQMAYSVEAMRAKLIYKNLVA